MTKHIIRKISTVAVATALTGFLIPAAQAQSTVVPDAADATGSNYDIRQVAVAHGKTRVAVNVKFTDLKNARSNAGAAIYFDVKASRPGPEYVLTTGLGPGTDYALVRMRDWKMYGEPKECRYSASLNYTDERLRVSADRSCFGTPTKLRVGVRMDDLGDSSHPITDWMSGYRKYTGWVANT